MGRCLLCFSQGLYRCDVHSSALSRLVPDARQFDVELLWGALVIGHATLRRAGCHRSDGVRWTVHIRHPLIRSCNPRCCPCGLSCGALVGVRLKYTNSLAVMRRGSSSRLIPEAIRFVRVDPVQDPVPLSSSCESVSPGATTPQPDCPVRWGVSSAESLIGREDVMAGSHRPASAPGERATHRAAVIRREAPVCQGDTGGMSGSQTANADDIPTPAPVVHMSVLQHLCF